ncbi:hypothetical protein EDB19DRAFT_1918515 [Suillus lakei]|nr:hypothetical protein EDB19DRAFT_1918515 [Suillus lakei]
MSDWSKLSGSVFSQASGALTEAKQQVSQAIPQKDLNPRNINWSKVSGAVISGASGALTEAKQLVNQAVSQKDVDPRNVDWSKLSRNVGSHASGALTDAKQLINQISQKDMDPRNVDWSKLSHNIGSHGSGALTDAKQLVNLAISQKDLDLRKIDWSKVSGNILSHASDTLTEVNKWSIRHPYIAAGALLTISATTSPVALPISYLPVQLIIWRFGFGSQGVMKGSFASQYQSHHYGGYVPRGSGFATLQSYGTMPASIVSSLSYTGAVIILGREWGWWL